jgi:hypothetical protein
VLHNQAKQKYNGTIYKYIQHFYSVILLVGLFLLYVYYVIQKN